MINVAFKISEKDMNYIRNIVEQITNHLTNKSIWALSSYLIYQCKFLMDPKFKV